LFRLTSLKNLERPVVFPQFFALPDEKNYHNLCKLISRMKY